MVHAGANPAQGVSAGQDLGDGLRRVTITEMVPDSP